MHDTLIASLVLTAVGMLVIFLFMGLLIGIVHFFVRIAARFPPDREEKVAVQDDGAVVAAITAALRQQEQKRN